LDAAFLRLLAAAVPVDTIVRDPSELLIYESDALVHLRSAPGAVVLPSSAAEVQAIVRLCHEHGVPFVAR
jgi:glycolate oxidase